MKEPCLLTLAEASKAIANGSLSSETLVRSCLARIAARDEEVKAWTCVDPQLAISAAREQDKRVRQGGLHGIPFGVKDMIDTKDLPTTYNSRTQQHYQPLRDASCVTVVRKNGALLLGKTDTVEYASFGRKAATRHPLNAHHTPGGSSSGSAAAVADFQVPFAFGTQTGGSLIRPASFNGIYALKPTWGAVSTYGARIVATSLDTIGWYGRSVDDLGLVAEAFNLIDPDAGHGDIVDAPLSTLRVGVCRTPQWSLIEAGGEKAFDLAVSRLRDANVIVEEVTLSADHDGLLDAQRVIYKGEAQASFLDLYLEEGNRLDPGMQGVFSADKWVTPARLHEAQRYADRCRSAFDDVFGNIDVLLAPATPGDAPEGLDTTGSPVFNSMWTLLRTPCLAIPCTVGTHKLPVGIQLIGPTHSDARLLAIARRLAPVIDVESLRA